MMKTIISKSILGLAAFSLVQGASAAVIIASGSSGNLAAKATFDLSGGNLTVTLENTSTTKTKMSAEVLTGVFFDIASGSLTPTSTSLNGSSVYNPKSVTITSAGSQWQYVGSLSTAVEGHVSGISATGLGLPSGNFGWGNFDTLVSHQVSGADYGLLPSTGVASGASNGFQTQAPFIQNSLQFILKATPNFSLDTLRGVSFLYGSALGENSLTGNFPPTQPVPEPSTYLAGLSALGMLALGYRKQK